MRVRAVLGAQGLTLSQEYRPKLAEYCVDAVQFISDAQRTNKKILIEGADALMASLPQLLPLNPLNFLEFGTYDRAVTSKTTNFVSKIFSLI